MSADLPDRLRDAATGGIPSGAIPCGPAFEIQVDADLSHAVTWRLRQIQIPVGIDDVVDGWTPLYVAEIHLDVVRSLAASFSHRRRIWVTEWWRAA